MSIREGFEKREKGFLSPHGCASVDTRGRQHPEAPSLIRTEFQRDRDRIVYCNAFRRLKYKTQVFLSPMGDQYRTRLTHTLEVAQIARTIARAMRLNEDLAEAIALGHDLGHTPFGHSGETALREIVAARFSHNRQSLRIVDVLEKNGKGLNLTEEVRDGILKHSKGFGRILPYSPENTASTVEGQVVRVADIMAYLNHDLEDAIRSGVITSDQIPTSIVRVLGQTHSQRATAMVHDLVFTSTDADGPFGLKLSDAVHEAMVGLRKFLYQNVYRSPQVHQEFVKAKKILSELFDHFRDHPKQLADEMGAMGLAVMTDQGEPIERTVCDFVASLTDRHALDLYQSLFFPSPVV